MKLFSDFANLTYRQQCQLGNKESLDRKPTLAGKILKNTTVLEIINVNYIHVNEAFRQQFLIFYPAQNAPFSTQPIPTLAHRSQESMEGSVTQYHEKDSLSPSLPFYVLS